MSHEQPPFGADDPSQGSGASPRGAGRHPPSSWWCCCSEETEEFSPTFPSDLVPVDSTQELDFRYVGSGSGEFDVTEEGLRGETPLKRQSRTFPAAVFLSVVLFLPGILVLIFSTSYSGSGPWSGGPAATTGGIDVVNEMSVPYDCGNGKDIWNQDWSTVRKLWCCHEVGGDCPPALAKRLRRPVAYLGGRSLRQSTAPGPLPYGPCSEGRVETWNNSKRIDCCGSFRVGCLAVGARFPHIS